jgi:hypothetical protein
MRTSSVTILALLALALLLNNNPLHAQWGDNNGPYGGQVLSFEIDGSNIYAGTALAGVFLSTDDGVTWARRISGLGNLSVNALKICGSYLFAGTNGGMFRTSNGGVLWEEVDADLPTSSVRAFTVTTSVGGRKLFAGTTVGYYTSLDDGDTWVKADTGIDHPYAYALASIGTTIFAGSWDGAYRSLDNGEHWITSYTGLSASNVYSLLVHDGNIYAGTEEGIFITTNLGESWSDINNGLDNVSYVYALAEAGGTIFAGDALNGVFRSTNGGGSWSDISGNLPDSSVNALAVSGSWLLAGSQGFGVLRTSLTGASWTESVGGLAATLITSMAAGDQALLAGTSYGLFRSTDEGESWVPANTGLTSRSVREIHALEGRILAGTYQGLFVSRNDGQSWTNITSDLNNTTVQAITHRITGSGDTIMYVGTDGGGVSSSIDGAHWSVHNSGLSSKTVRALAILDSFIYAGTGYGVFRSKLDTLQWSRLDSGLGRLSIHEVVTGPPGSGLLYAGTYLSAVYRSTDYGNHWSQFGSFNFGYSTIQDLQPVGTNLFAATSLVGIWLSTDRGSHWSDENDGLPYEDIQSLAVLNGNLYAGARAGGVWKRPLSEMVTGVPEDGPLPAEYALGQNYPNPFNPATSIKFQIPDIKMGFGNWNLSFVSLKVYDVLGREVATLVEGVVPAGEHTVHWDASGFAGGIYFYRLSGTTGDVVRKMVLLK